MEEVERLFNQGQFRQVLEKTRSTLDPPVLFLRARAALELGEAQYARELLTSPEPFANPEWESRRLAWLGWTYLALGDPTTGQSLILQAAQLHQGHFTLFHLAHGLPPAEARPVLLEALALASNPTEEGQAALALARTHERLGQFREGLNYASLAYLRMPDDSGTILAYATLSLIGGQATQPAHLVQLLEPLVEQGGFAYQVAALNLLADIYLVLGQPQKAQEVVGRATQLAGQKHLPLVCLVAVRVHLALGQRDRALAVVQASQLASKLYPAVMGNLHLARGMALYPGAEAELAFIEAIEQFGSQVPAGVLVAKGYLAQLRNESLDDAAVESLQQWSKAALNLYPPLQQATQRSGYRLKALASAQLVGPDGPISLRPRGLEMLVLLLSRPQGWEREELSEALYGEARPLAFKSEIFRLRNTLGPVIEPRPWRITQPIAADFLEVRDWLDRGEIAAALAAYPGPLLPQSDAPGIVELRDELLGDLHQAILARNDPNLLFGLSQKVPDDLELLEQLLEGLPRNDWRSPVILSRIKRLRQTYEA